MPRTPWLLASVLVPLVSGCNTGCSDIKVTDSIQVRLEQQTMGDDRTLRLKFCQHGRCSELETPAAEAVITLSTSELSPAPDLGEAGEITAEVTDAVGRVVGTTSAPFDFEASTLPDECDSALHQVITIEPSRVS